MWWHTQVETTSGHMNIFPPYSSPVDITTICASGLGLNNPFGMN